MMPGTEKVLCWCLFSGEELQYTRIVGFCFLFALPFRMVNK